MKGLMVKKFSMEAVIIRTNENVRNKIRSWGGGVEVLFLGSMG